MRALIALVVSVLIVSAARAEGEGGTTLLDAVHAGDIMAVEASISAGASLEARDPARRTPLLIAVRANNVDVARLLIEAGADVNAKDNIRDTPFLYAGAEGRNDILRMILATGRAKLDDRNRYGGNALIPAAHHGHPDTVRILIEAGLDLDHVNDLGWTALLETVILGDGGPVYQEIATLLVEAGADRSIADRDGVSPLAHAERRGFADLAAIIRRDINR